LFGKPDINGSRRMGVTLALADTLEAAKEKASRSAVTVKVSF